jgi:(4S)-4-hydroxy-5-phosphonooxypentane-2,3-dione isomerase
MDIYPFIKTQVTQRGGAMFGILLKIEAKPGKHQELIDFLAWEAKVCREEEPGTLRFEFYQDPENANALYLYEAFRDHVAHEQHLQNEPLQRWSSGLEEELKAELIVLFSGEALFSPTDNQG